MLGIASIAVSLHCALHCSPCRRLIRLMGSLACLASPCVCALCALQEAVTRLIGVQLTVGKHGQVRGGEGRGGRGGGGRQGRAGQNGHIRGRLG